MNNQNIQSIIPSLIIENKKEYQFFLPIKKGNLMDNQIKKIKKNLEKNNKFQIESCYGINMFEEIGFKIKKRKAMKIPLKLLIQMPYY